LRGERGREKESGGRREDAQVLKAHERVEE